MKLEDISTGSPAYINPDDLIHHTALPETKISLMFDALIKRVGELFSWVWIVLVGVIISNVVMRYVFHNGLIEFEEIQWHLYSLGWLMGLSYCFVADEHVRVDLIHDRMSLVTQAWVELLGMLLLLLPFIALVVIYAVPFVLYSWEVSEISDAPGGLPYRWVIKSALLAGFALLLLAFISRFSRVISLLHSRYIKGIKPKELSYGN
ncbi:MAG: TRAP transporter small permease subunit [Neptuniibacter sp.]|uniref:TRAP transporter small permease subunit n=1 Tax=Neptuniibacter sp. TaxID=1962643 RepID=UPI003B5A1B01